MVGRPAAQRGVTYLLLLLSVALISGVLAASASIVSHNQRREREKQLLWAGNQIREALLSYAAAGGAAGTFPRDLSELLKDPRSPAPRRHLRRIYPDPMTGDADWVVIRNSLGGIVGVASRSELAPIKKGNFPEAYGHFAGAQSYADWKFLVIEGALAPPRVQPR